MINQKIIKGVGEFEGSKRGCSCELEAPASTPSGVPVYLIEETTGEESIGQFGAKHPDDPGQAGRLVIPNLEELYVELDYIRNARGPMATPFAFKIQDLPGDISIGPNLYTQTNDQNPGVIDLDYGVSIDMMTAEERAMVLSTTPKVRIKIPFSGSTGYLTRLGTRFDDYSSAISGPYRIYAKVSQPLSQDLIYLNW